MIMRSNLLYRMGWIGALYSVLLVLAGCTLPTVTESGAILSVTTSDASHTDTLPTLEPAPLDDGERLRVVATTNIVADVVAQVGGEQIELVGLMPPGADPHSFEPTPQDLIALNEAHLIMINGLNLEEALMPTWETLDDDVPVVSINVGVETLEFGETDYAHAEHGDEDSPTRRLLISDMDDGLIEIVDPHSGELLERLPLTSPARLYTSENHRFAFAVQTDSDRVDVIDGGLWTEDHGDHLHGYEEAPALLDVVVTGSRPIHLVAHDGRVAIFFDGDGAAQLIQQQELEASDPASVGLDSGLPHHGVAVPVGDRVLLSMPDTESDSALPIGVAVYSLDGELLQSFPDCAGLHGEAARGNLVAFGCSDGVLIIDTSGEEATAQKIENPADAGDNRVGTILAHEALPFFVGNFGSQALAIIDPAAGSLTPLPLPAASAGFQLDPSEDAHLVVLTVDGQLHTLDPQTGETLASAPLIAAVDPDTDHSEPNPVLAVDAGMAYASDHTTGTVFAVDLDTMDVVQTYQAAGIPLSLTTVGVHPDFMVDAEHDHAEHDHASEEEAHEQGAEADAEHDHAHAEEEGHHHHHEGPDPHTWFSIHAVEQWVENIEQLLSDSDPANAEVYAANAAAYLAELEALDMELDALVAQLPEARRKLVTDHDSFGYFVAEYDFDKVGTVIQSFSTLASPSAAQLAELQEQIEAEGIEAIFVGTTVNPDLAEQVAVDTGIRVVPIYTGSLSEEGGPAASYIDFMRYNVTAIVDALRE